MSPNLEDLTPPVFDLFRVPTFGRIFVDFWVTFGSLRRPFPPLWGHFAALVGPVGVLWGAFGFPLLPIGVILVALWLKLGSFGALLARLWHPLAPFWTFLATFSNFLVVLQLFRSHPLFPRPAGGTIAAGNRDRSKNRCEN